MSNWWGLCAIPAALCIGCQQRHIDVKYSRFEPRIAIYDNRKDRLSIEMSCGNQCPEDVRRGEVIASSNRTHVTAQEFPAHAKGSYCFHIWVRDFSGIETPFSVSIPIYHKGKQQQLIHLMISPLPSASVESENGRLDVMPVRRSR